MDNIEGKMIRLEGTVDIICDDFDTTEHIVKEKAVAFLLNKDNNGKVIVVYDKNAVELGLIKIGEQLTCLGYYQGIITVIDSKGKIIEDKMFLCFGIMGNADINEEQLMEKGAYRLR